MSQSHQAVPTAPAKLIIFPENLENPDWKSRFKRIIDNGKGHFLCFPFSYIRNKDALFELYEVVGEVFQKYPSLAVEFFDDVDRTCELAEKSIEEERLKKLPCDPGQLVPFKKSLQKKGGCYGK